MSGRLKSGKENQAPNTSITINTPSKKLNKQFDGPDKTSTIRLPQTTPSKQRQPESILESTLLDLDNGNEEENEDENCVDSDEYNSDLEDLSHRQHSHRHHPSLRQQQQKVSTRTTISSSAAPRTTLSSIQRTTLNGSRSGQAVSFNRPTLSSNSNSRPTISRHQQHHESINDLQNEFFEESEEVMKNRLEVEKYMSDRSLLRQLLDERRQLHSTTSKLTLENDMLKNSLSNKEKTLQQQQITYEGYQTSLMKETQQYCKEIAKLEEVRQNQTDTISQHEAIIQTLNSELAVMKANLETMSKPTLSRRKSTLRKSLASDPTLPSVFDEFESVKTKLYTTTQDNDSLKTKVRLLEIELKSTQQQQQNHQHDGEIGGNKNIVEKYQSLLKEKRELQLQVSSLQSQIDPTCHTSSSSTGARPQRKTTRSISKQSATCNATKSDDGDSDNDDDVDLLRSRLTQKNEECTTIKKLNEKLTLDCSTLQEKSKRADLEYKQLTRDYDDLEVECNEIGDELNSLRATHRELEQKHNIECTLVNQEAEKLQQIVKEFSIDHNTLKQCIDSLEVEKIKLETELKAQQAQLKSATSFQEANVTKLAADNRCIQQSLDEYKSARLELETRCINSENQYQQLLLNENEFRHKIELLEEEMREKDDEIIQLTKVSGKELQLLKDRLEKSQLDYNSMLDDDNLVQSKLKRKVQELEIELESISEEFRNLEKSSEEVQIALQNDLDSKDDALHEITRKYKKLQQLHQQMREENNSLPDPKQLSSEFDEKLTQKQHQFDEKMKSIQMQHEQRYELLFEDYNVLKSKYDCVADQFDSFQSSYNIDTEALSHKLETMRGQFDEKGSSYNALILRFTTLERDYQIIKQENEVIDKQRKQYLTSINETQNTISFLNKDISTLQQQVTVLNDAVKDYQEQLNVSNAEMNDANEFVADLEVRYEKSKKLAFEFRGKYRSLKEEHALLSTRYTNLEADNHDLQQQIQQLVIVKGGSKVACSSTSFNANVTGNLTQQFSSQISTSTFQPTVPQSVIKQRRLDLQHQKSLPVAIQPQCQSKQSCHLEEELVADNTSFSTFHQSSSSLNSTASTTDSSVIGLSSESAISRMATRRNGAPSRRLQFHE